MFKLCTSSVTRGHVYKLYKPCTSSLRSRFFASRVINSWNSQPPSTDFSSVNAFKRSISSVDFSQFLPRDAMHKRGICRHPVSVCLSVTFVSCAKTNKDIFEIFSPSGSQAILVFPYQKGWHYSNGNPLNGGVECKGV